MITPVQMNLNRIVRLEDSRLKDIHSVDSYIEELRWMESLIGHHINRCQVWQMESPRGKGAYGKLNDFLETLEG